MEKFAEPSLPIEMQTLRDMTSAMLIAADKGLWLEVQRIDKARLEFLQLVPADLFVNHSETVRTVLAEALSATRSIEQKAITERDHHGDELIHTKQRKHAAMTYNSHASVF